MRIRSFLLCTLVGCSRPVAESTHTLVFGGDVTLGRNVNPALFDPTARTRMFADVADLMRDADITLVNAEGVISGGGRFYDKGESRPYTYRAHPVAMDVLADIGVDVLAAGNNHANDYGPLALQEMLDRAAIAGIAVVGAGSDLHAARQPVYVERDGLVVAFIGGDLTHSEKHGATDTLAGTHWLPGLDRKRRKAVVSALEPLLEDAQQHADLVFFTPHWGENWKTAPTPHVQALAESIIGLGFDGILGHSAHILQGVGRIDGRPVVFDAGNLLSDYNPPKEHARSALFRLHIGPDGVTDVEAVPLALRTNQVVRVEGAALERHKAALIEASAPLGVALTDRGDRVGAPFSPPAKGWGDGPTTPPPARTVPAEVRLAPAELILDALPSSATPTNVQWPGGLELVGYELLLDALRVPKSGQVTTLYWRATQAQSADLWLRAGGRRTTGRVRPMDHLPGDWLLPGDRWPVGAIIRDQTLVRLTGDPEGTITFTAGVLTGQGGRPVRPIRSDLPLTDDGEVILGEATYVEGSPGIWGAWPRP